MKLRLGDSKALLVLPVFCLEFGCVEAWAPLYGNLYPQSPPSRRRSVQDGFATPEECRPGLPAVRAPAAEEMLGTCQGCLRLLHPCGPQRVREMLCFV